MATATQQLRGTFNADQGHSTFQAKAKHMEVGSFRTSFDEVEARLSDESGKLVLEGTAQVESISIRKPADLREHVVNGADFFDAANHPVITYRSDKIDLADDGTVVATGELTIKDETREVEAVGTWQQPVEDPYGNQRTALELTAVIDRREFGLNWQADLPKGGKALGWDVEISIHLELIQEG
jgi:polyisoprenoid-binding protein YceI